MVFVRMLAKLLKDKEIGELIVPIVPDEARTFGMESLFRQVGIYSHVGQLYEPVDMDTLLYYKEAKEGQILEEGITEAGSISSFIAAGTAYATHGINTIPFFIYYSMFGMQRVGDLVWAAGDSRTRGFMLGGTAGRTTLAGEGLQHQDGHSHLLSLAVPNLISYDPAFAYEIAVIIEEGIRRMYVKGESIFYYITVMNEHVRDAADARRRARRHPEGDVSLQGVRETRREKEAARGRSCSAAAPSCPKSIKAAKMLEDQYGVAADVWSVTSYQELYRDGHAVERWNRLHPDETPRVPYVTQCFAGTRGPDRCRLGLREGAARCASIAGCRARSRRWAPTVSAAARTAPRSATSSRSIAASSSLATLTALARDGKIDIGVVEKAIKDLKSIPRSRTRQSLNSFDSLYEPRRHEVTEQTSS